MTELSDYQRLVSEPYKKKLLGIIKDQDAEIQSLRERVKELQTQCAGYSVTRRIASELLTSLNGHKTMLSSEALRQRLAGVLDDFDEDYPDEEYQQSLERELLSVYRKLLEGDDAS